MKTHIKKLHGWDDWGPPPEKPLAGLLSIAIKVVGWFMALCFGGVLALLVVTLLWPFFLLYGLVRWGDHVRSKPTVQVPDPWPFSSRRWYRTNENCSHCGKDLTGKPSEKCVECDNRICMNCAGPDKLCEECSEEYDAGGY